FNSLASEAQRGIDGLAHGAAEGHAFFELQGDGFGDQRGIELRTVHFLDVDMHFALGAFLDFALELVDFGAFAPDDDSRARGKEAHDQLVGGALDINRADAGGFQAVLQRFAQLDVFVEQVGVIAVGVPARLPGLVVAEAKSVWMCLLSQGFLRSFFDLRAGFFFPARAWRAFLTAPATPFCDSASATAGATRSCAAAGCSDTANTIS